MPERRAPHRWRRVGAAALELAAAIADALRASLGRPPKRDEPVDARLEGLEPALADYIARRDPEWFELRLPRPGRPATAPPRPDEPLSERPEAARDAPGHRTDRDRSAPARMESEGTGRRSSPPVRVRREALDAALERPTRAAGSPRAASGPGVAPPVVVDPDARPAPTPSLPHAGRATPEAAPRTPPETRTDAAVGNPHVEPLAAHGAERHPPPPTPAAPDPSVVVRIAPAVAPPRTDRAAEQAERRVASTAPAAAEPRRSPWPPAAAAAPHAAARRSAARTSAPAPVHPFVSQPREAAPRSDSANPRGSLPAPWPPLPPAEPRGDPEWSAGALAWRSNEAADPLLDEQRST